MRVTLIAILIRNNDIRLLCYFYGDSERIFYLIQGYPSCILIVLAAKLKVTMPYLGVDGMSNPKSSLAYGFMKNAVSD